MSKSMGIVPALGFKFVKDQTSVLHKPKVWYTCQQMEELFWFLVDEASPADFIQAVYHYEIFKAHCCW